MAGFKIQVGPNRRSRVRFVTGPIAGRSLVFASGDDAADAVKTIKLMFPGVPVQLQPTDDEVNTVQTTDTADA